MWRKLVVLKIVVLILLGALSEAAIQCYYCTQDSSPCVRFNTKLPQYTTNCPNSTMCLTIVSMTPQCEGQIIERGCADQMYMDTIFDEELKRTVEILEIMEVYEEGCQSEAADDYNVTPANMCYCRGDLCNFKKARVQPLKVVELVEDHELVAVDSGKTTTTTTTIPPITLYEILTTPRSLIENEVEESTIMPPTVVVDASTMMPPTVVLVDKDVKQIVAIHTQAAHKPPAVETIQKSFTLPTLPTPPAVAKDTPHENSSMSPTHTTNQNEETSTPATKQIQETSTSTAKQIEEASTRATKSTEETTPQTSTMKPEIYETTSQPSHSEDDEDDEDYSEYFDLFEDHQEKPPYCVTMYIENDQSSNCVLEF